MKKVCVVTTTRADYGILKNTIRAIQDNPRLMLCLVVTGTHLSQAYGHTVDEIVRDGFPIAEELPMFLDASQPAAISKSMGRLMESFSDVLLRQKPDMLLVLGDRYELISICMCAVNMQIPIAHISGGEITEGAIDDVVRHCVTKMSSLHFPGCEEYRQRIIQLGEQPSSVFNFGDVGVENIAKMTLIPVAELEKDLGIKLENYACMTFHPLTSRYEEAERQIDEVLKAVGQYNDMEFIITKANADAGGQLINDRLEEYAAAHPNCHLFASLGIQRYISLLKHAKAVIGNSSSGIVEAPVLKIPTVNIGDRQKGRLMAESIISCAVDAPEIARAMELAFSAEGQERAKQAVSLYGDGNVSEKIVEKIVGFLEDRAGNEPKKFFDLEFGWIE